MKPRLKVGILTYHTGTNYGGTLQCYALQTAIEQLGHEAEVIDYRPYQERPPLWKNWQLRHRGLSFIPLRLLQILKGNQLLKRFWTFRKEYLKLSPCARTCEEFNQLLSRYDAIVIGSDQVWNFHCPAPFFLGTNNEFKGKRISYAVSCTQEEQPAHRIPEVSSWIQQFDAISVRETFSAHAVAKTSGCNAIEVADPTLLLGNDWPCKSKRELGDKIIIYRLGAPMPGDFSGLIAEIKQRTDAASSEAIVAVNSNPLFCPEADQTSLTTTPLEWADKIRNCRFLITDSYHAALFAWRYQIPFIAYYAEQGRAPRLLDMGKRFDLSNRIFNHTDKAMESLSECLEPPIPPSEHIQRFISDSRTFLENAIQSNSTMPCSESK